MDACLDISKAMVQAGIKAVAKKLEQYDAEVEVMAEEETASRVLH